MVENLASLTRSTVITGVTAVSFASFMIALIERYFRCNRYGVHFKFGKAIMYDISDIFLEFFGIIIISILIPLSASILIPIVGPGYFDFIAIFMSSFGFILIGILFITKPLIKTIISKHKISRLFCFIVLLTISASIGIIFAFYGLHLRDNVLAYPGQAIYNNEHDPNLLIYTILIYSLVVICLAFAPILSRILGEPREEVLLNEKGQIYLVVIRHNKKNWALVYCEEKNGKIEVEAGNYIINTTP